MRPFRTPSTAREPSPPTVAAASSGPRSLQGPSGCDPGVLSTPHPGACSPRSPGALRPVPCEADHQLALGVLFQKLDGIAHGQNGLCCIVRDLATEFFLEGHDKLHGVEAVGSEVIDEARAFGHLVRLRTEMFHDNLLHPLGNVTHASTSCVSERARFGRATPNRCGAVSSWLTRTGRTKSQADHAWSIAGSPGVPRQAGLRLPYFPGLGQHDGTRCRRPVQRTERAQIM